MRVKGLAPAGADQAVTLRRHPSEVERARRHVADACRDYPGDIACTAMLLTSELITNALEHGAGTITLLVSCRRNEVQVEVTDESPMTLRPRRASADDEGGRGLLIVDTLASAWGTRPLARSRGKSVWFALTV